MVITEGYEFMSEGKAKTVEQGHVAIEVLSDFVSHKREHVAKGARLTVPRALATAMIGIGHARELTAEEYAEAGEPTPAGAVEDREPGAETRDPRTRKR